MKFLRRDFLRYSKIGKNRKKIQKWRKPKGRHNKMREKRKGYPATVSIGYRKKSEESGKIKGHDPVRIFNMNDLEGIGKGQAVIIAKVGAKKKIDIIKKAQDKKITILNLREGGKRR